MMRKRWAVPLLAFFTLLWTRLPGPSSGSGRFLCRPCGTGKIFIQGEVFWLSGYTQGITIQKLTYQGGWWPLEDSIESWVSVEYASPDAAELEILNPEVEWRLLNDDGYYAFVTGRVEEDYFYKEADIIVEGEGIGLWKIM